MSTNTVYRTQAEAKRDIVIAIWGDVTFAKRPFVRGDRTTSLGGTVIDEKGQLVDRAMLETVVSANVNGRLVTFSFDQYGRSATYRPTIVGAKTGA